MEAGVVKLSLPASKARVRGQGNKSEPASNWSEGMEGGVLKLNKLCDPVFDTIEKGGK